MRLLFLPVLTCLFAFNPANAQSELQKTLKDLDIAPHWIYDDLPKAAAEAKSSGKPLLVVLRCVPCPPGKTLDGQVMKPDADMEKLEKQFVCVRIIQTKGLDLKIFQYDYDQSWTAMFLNADMTIYGRYGSRTSSGPQSDFHLSLGSFRKAMERALELHKGYPNNKTDLAGKTSSKEPDYPKPEMIPTLKDRASMETTRMNCIHCHMVREHIIRQKWVDKKLTLADLRIYPMPDNIGLIIDEDDGLLVKSVKENTPASKAGLMAGDQLVLLNGQRLMSLADVQWVLHTSPEDAKIVASIKRKGETMEKTLSVSGDWKQSDIAWRASSGFGLRRGLKVDPLPAAEKEKRKIPADKMALIVKFMFTMPGSVLPKSGLKVGDVIVAVDGNSDAMTEAEFLINLRLKHGPDDTIKFTVLRGEKREELTAPLW